MPKHKSTIKRKLTKDYILENIEDFRSRFEKIPEAHFEDNHVLYIFPTTPTQILAINMGGTESNCLIFFHNKDRQDLEIELVDVNISSFRLENLKNSITLLEDLTDDEFRKVNNFILSFSTYDDSDIDWVWDPLVENVGIIVLAKPFSYVHFAISDGLLALALRFLKRVEEKATITKTVGAIKKEIEEIQTPELKKRILNETEKLENKIAELNERLDSEIGGVRKIIGDSQEFQDFRVFSTDISDLKRSHVPKEVFDSKINELNARIDGFIQVRDSYENMLSEQREFMKQQSEVIGQQASFMTWLKYATILLPVAVIAVPVIEIIRALLNL